MAGNDADDGGTKTQPLNVMRSSVNAHAGSLAPLVMSSRMADSAGVEATSRDNSLNRENWGGAIRRTPPPGVRPVWRARSRLVLHAKVKAEELACPLMLWNSGETLIQEEAQAAVVGADEEAAPMADRLDEANQLAFVGSELGVARCSQLAEECHQVGALMKNSA